MAYAVMHDVLALWPWWCIFIWFISWLNCPFRLLLLVKSPTGSNWRWKSKINSPTSCEVKMLHAPVEATTQYDISFILSKMKNRKFTLLPFKKVYCHCWALWRRMVVAAFLLCSHWTHFLFVHHQVQPTLSEKSLRKCDAASRRLWQQSAFSASESDHLDQLSTFLALGAVGPYVAEMTSCKVTEACRGAPHSVFTSQPVYRSSELYKDFLWLFVWAAHKFEKGKRKRKNAVV